MLLYRKDTGRRALIKSQQNPRRQATSITGNCEDDANGRWGAKLGRQTKRKAGERVE